MYEEANKALKLFVLKNNGDHNDVDDTIQDAIIVFYEKIKDANFKLHTSVSGYIYTVGKFIWYNKLREKKKITLDYSKELEDYDLSIEEIELLSVNKENIVDELLNEIGGNCKKVLIESIYQNLSMQEIATLNNLKNEQIARNKKHKCLKKLRDMIQRSKYFQGFLND